MALIEHYHKEPNLFDIPLYRQRLLAKQKETCENEKDFIEYADTVKLGRNYGSASQALEGYISDFERRPADMLVAFNYGGTLEHIPVPCPRPPLNLIPDRGYLPSVTELLSSDARHAFTDLVPTPIISPEKPRSPKHSPPNAMKGIFWEVSEKPKPKEPRLSLSPIKPSPFEKMVDLSKPFDDVISMDAKCERILRKYSPPKNEKPSPFENLVDLSVPPLEGISLDSSTGSSIKELGKELQGHKCPSWVGEIDLQSTVSTAKPEKQYKIPEWVKELQDAETSDVLSIIERRIESPEKKPPARLLTANQKGDVRDRLLHLSTDDFVYKLRSSVHKSSDPRRNRSHSEESAVFAESADMKEKALSWTSLATSEGLEKELDNDRLKNATEKIVAEILSGREPSDSASCHDKPIPSTNWGRPMEKLKNMLFAVQSLDSENMEDEKLTIDTEMKKETSFLDDEELAKLAEDSAPLKKALDHLTNVRHLINNRNQQQ